MEFIKDMHFSPDLEAAVLGAAMLESTAFGRTHGIVSHDTFYSDANKIVYAAIYELYAAAMPIDILTVVDRIMNVSKVEEFSGVSVKYYVIELTRAIVSTAHIEYHCLVLKRMWMEREVIKITNGAIDLEGDVNQQLIQLQTAIRDINAGDYTKEWYDMSELMVDLIKHQEEIKANPDAVIKTGIRELDEKNGGFMPGNVVVIGARPGVGKSAFMGQMAMNMARNKKKVGIISLEMSNNEIAGRLASLDSGVDFQRIYRNLFQDEREQQKFYDRISSDTINLPIYVSDSTRVNTIDIRSKADKLKAKHGLDILFIDYLQLISADQPKNKTRENIISEISRSTKIMAKEMKIPIIILCQLNRESTKRTGDSRYPVLSDLRESGAIEQDADVVMFLHRDWISGITENEQGQSTENTADLVVRKWRNAEPNLHVALGFDGPRMKFIFNPQGTGWRPMSAIKPDVDYTSDNPF
jgi:replicative DNA helicase